MDARLLPMGHSALLVEVPDTGSALALRAQIAARVAAAEGVWTAVDHLVVGARTVLVVLADPAPADDVARACLVVAEGVDASASRGLTDAASTGRVVEVPVRYDGPDLDEVAALTGLTPQEVVRAHTGVPWRVGFGGFAPGFAYLVGGDPRLRVPRRHEPRTTVPAGSVALAGEFSGIYPHDSPGGWRLLGSTQVVLWDAERDPPALLAPGDAVHFVEDRSPAPSPTPTLPPSPPPTLPPSPPPTPIERAIRPLSGRTDRSLDQGDGVMTGTAGLTGVARGLEVLATGPLTLVEDLGRPGLADAGVGRSGAADPAAYLLGLRLVGHHPARGAAHEGAASPASLEVTLGGLSVRARGDLLVALTGAPCPATVDGRPVPHAAPIALGHGQVLTLGSPAAGLRTWLAVRGGIDVPPVLGSRSIDTLARVGPRVPAEGDVLPVGRAPRGLPHVELAPHAPPAAGMVVLDVVPGPRADWCAVGDLDALTWTVSSRGNRVGIRLEGNQIRWKRRYAARELPSEGMVVGAVQVPPGGEPVVFLADHPVTGGYPVVAILTPDAVALATQLRPGQAVRLRWSPAAR